LSVEVRKQLYFLGCMRDIRFNGQWFPMDVTQNRESSAAEYLMRSQNVFDGCLSEVCHWPSGLRCAAGLQCIDLLRHAECRQVII